MRRLVARAVYSFGPTCFACGRRGAQPCAGHEYGGVIGQWRGRRWIRWAPWWMVRWIDPRWTL